jgi:hypothetical protein
MYGYFIAFGAGIFVCLSIFIPFLDKKYKFIMEMAAEEAQKQYNNALKKIKAEMEAKYK